MPEGGRDQKRLKPIDSKKKEGVKVRRFSFRRKTWECSRGIKSLEERESETVNFGLERLAR